MDVNMYSKPKHVERCWMVLHQELSNLLCNLHHRLGFARLFRDTQSHRMLQCITASRWRTPELYHKTQTGTTTGRPCESTQVRLHQFHVSRTSEPSTCNPCNG